MNPNSNTFSLLKKALNGIRDADRVKKIETLNTLKFIRQLTTDVAFFTADFLSNTPTNLHVQTESPFYRYTNHTFGDGVSKIFRVTALPHTCPNNANLTHENAVHSRQKGQNTSKKNHTL